MNKQILSAVSALLLIFTLKAEDTLFCTGETNAEFSVKATMHSFTGTTGNIEFSATGVIDTSIGDTSIFMDIKVPVKNMKTGKEKRDKNMYSMFESKKHPYITVTVKNVSIDAARPGMERPGRIPFYLKIRDIKNAQSAEVTNWKEKNDKIIFTASQAAHDRKRS